MTVLNKIPVKTYTTARPRKLITTRKVTTRKVTTKRPLNNVVTVPTSGEATVLETIENDEQFSIVSSTVASPLVGTVTTLLSGLLVVTFLVVTFLVVISF